MERLGIALVWDVRDYGELEEVWPEKAGDLMKIAQEALANVMRHAQAGTVRLSCGVGQRANTLVLEIADDGRGIDRPALDAMLRGEPSGQCGNGLRNIRLRAQRLDARLDVESQAPHGTVLRLTLPLAVALRKRPAHPPPGSEAPPPAAGRPQPPAHG